MSPDVINGLFEFAGSIALGMDIRELYKDKEVKGVYWPAKLFFLSWGLWNIYFYGYYDHVWSFYGGLAMSVCNLTWFILAWKYTRQAENAHTQAILDVIDKAKFKRVS